MKTGDLLELAGRNLRKSKLRNGLTIAGIAVGVASLVAMLSLGIGLQQLASTRLKRSGIFDTVFVTSRQDVRGGDEAGDTPQNTGEAPVLDDNARAAMAKLSHVAEVQPEIRVMAEVRRQDKNYPALLAGLPLSAADNESFDKLEGKFFTSLEADEVILQKDFARRIDGNPESLIGREVTLRYAERRPGEASAGTGFSVTREEKQFRVVGLLDAEPFGGLRMISRARVFIPSGTAERLNMMQMADATQAMRGDMAGKTYSMLTVRVNRTSDIDGVQEAIKRMGFRAYSILDATQSLRRFFAIFDMFLGIFGSLALAVASLAIVNTLVMAVLERRREIGIMKAIGAADGDVKKLFFAEAAVMGLVGGGVGVLLGWLMGRAINFGTNIYLARHQFPAENLWQVPWWLVLGAVAFAALVSLAAGIYPALRAARLEPIAALRYE